ncbi:TonB-dependent receptor [Glaciecola sp. 33A]|uniref:TonB-dependent receptor n=1 Tax=Glaciecola sp. 33A TaxID=2057807 RepID=UPI000C34F7AE|nr:TonB-dependent receptor [Glaciecola sp. 33A]PKI00965.1 cell envelope biogenesis protein OmpA [Glaciecola sp. 33A]
MFRNTKLSRTAIAVAMSIGMSTAAMAQVTSSGMTGSIVGPQGNPAAGTVVTVTHEPTGATKTVTVSENGTFNLTGLRVGGPYTIKLDSTSLNDETITGVFLTLGEDYPIEVALVSDEDVERISVTGSRMNSVAFGKNSPATTFGIDTLENVPAINRDITDILRIDPRVYVDEAGQNSIQCAGKSPRFNSLTVDGVRLSDSFGLNSNGYPTERMPFSFDAIEQVAVELAPVSVIYGGFTACNINAVAKTGTNEFHGSAFYDYTNDSLKGDSLEGDNIALSSFNEKRFGFTVGGPLIQDTLFFFAAYEKLEGNNLFERGATGSGAVVEVEVTQAELDEIASISNNLYGFDPGGIPASLANEDEKLLIKLDWNINEQHRASFTYNYNDGLNFNQSDGDDSEFEFENHLYERGAELTSLVGSLYSDWTDSFSTEIRIVDQELDNRQNSRAGDGTIGGNDFGEIRVELDNVDVYLGSDDSRQANDLNWEQFGIILRGTYYFDNDHTVTFGYERDELDIFNLFVQHTETEIRFDGIENFRNGFADAIYYNNAPSGNPLDAAADWGYAVNSLYIQDSFYLTDDLSVTAGLRYEWYTSSDAPAENAQFVEQYGFSNSGTIDGEGLLQPRIGLNYTLSDNTELRGGLALYSGGNPNVWLSNNFSNTNVTQFGARGRDYGYTDGSRSLFDADVVYSGLEAGVPNGPGYGVPSEMFDAVAGGTGANFEVNYLDPDFKLPSELKLTAGMTHLTDSGYVFDVDLIISRTYDAAIVLKGDLVEEGVTDNGYIDYASPNIDAFKLTNSSADSTSLSLAGSMTKSWDNGIQLTTGYAYSDAEDSQPMNSAVAFSNYQFRAYTNPNEQVSSLSDWNIEHRITVDFRYTVELIDGLQTRFSAFGLSQSGSPYSRVLENGNSEFGFTPFLERFDSGSGAVLPIGSSRNSMESSWWTKVDISVRQDIPAFAEGHSANVYFIVDNFTNMLNDDWGVLYEAPNIVRIGDTTPETRQGDASQWELRFGVQYKF